MVFSFFKNKTVNSPAWVNRIIKSKKEYPFFDAVVLVYVAFMLVFQILIQISPFVSLISRTPFASMMTYLGGLGGILLAVDVFTTKKVFKGKYCYLLYVIALFAGIASVRMLSYGSIKENVFKICHAVIQFALVYSCVYRLSKETLKKSIRVILDVIAVIWFVGCIVSIFQYANLIKYSYVVNPMGMDSSATRQGFFDNRLFGIFYTLNHAAYVSLILFISLFFRILKQKKTFNRVCLIIAEVVFLFHMILTNSRSAMVSFSICSFVAAWLFLRKKEEQDAGFKKKLITVALSLLLALGCVLSTKGIKYALTYLPTANAAVVKFLDKNNVKLFGKSVSELLLLNIDYDEDVLTRDNLEEDPSNGRLQLWGDYLSLYKDIGLVGISPGSYMAYVCENHDDLYIVQQTKLEYPDKFESNIIIHVHNGYIMVFVAAGLVGVLSLLAFIALCAKDVLYVIFKEKNLNKTLICAFLLVIACAVSAMFDEGIFFQSSPQTTIFWLALGFIMKECEEYKQLENKEAKV